MARMLPTYLSEDIKSPGEKQLFTLFENDPYTDNWTILHSLNISQHIKRMYGEIDFVVMAPNLGVFCLEVKSGGVERKNGIWRYTNRFGRTEEKTRGPFQQAQEGMFSIKDSIRRKYGNGSRLNKILFGFGVMFPHVVFQSEGVEEEQGQIYDRNSKRFPISEYIKKLASYTRKKAERSGWFESTESLPTKKDIEELLTFLRGDFEKVVRPIQLIDESEEQLNAFTLEQYACLDQLSENKRSMIQGPAGTGKTMIALESVRRGLSENKRILFLCYNSLLGNWLSLQFPNHSQENLYVGNFHGLLIKLSRDVSHEKENETYDDNYFKKDLPLYALDAIDQGLIKPFDKIIIDEGQDLLTDEYLDVLDSLIIGGLAGGNWEIYCDFEKQAIYADITKQEMLTLLMTRANFVNFKLNVNCRNTRPIGEEVSLICGIEKMSYLPNKLAGLSVDYSFYKNKEEEAQKLEAILMKLKSQNIPNKRISILSSVKFENSIASRIDTTQNKIIEMKNIISRNLTNYPVSFSTIHAFKGMENSFIILTDLERISGIEMMRLLYVGMSRARVGLFVMLNKNTEKDFKELVRQALGKNT